jgi:hypothetical protein
MGGRSRERREMGGRSVWREEGDGQEISDWIDLW